MLNILMIVGTLLVLLYVAWVIFSTKAATRDRPKLHILDINSVHALTPDQLRDVISSGIDTLLEFYRNMLTLEWNAIDIRNLLKDTSRFLATQNTPEWMEDAASSWAASKVAKYKPIREEEEVEDDLSMFYLIRNLRLIVMLKPDTGVMDLRWMQLLIEICRANAAFAIRSEAPAPEEQKVLDMNPDVIPQRGRVVKGRGSTGMLDVYMDDMEKESHIRKQAAPVASVTKSGDRVGFGIETDSLVRGCSVKALRGPAPQAGFLDRGDLDNVRKRLLGEVDPTRTATLAHDYAYLDDHPIVYDE